MDSKDHGGWRMGQRTERSNTNVHKIVRRHSVLAQPSSHNKHC